MLIPGLAIIYLLAIYLVLTLIQRSRKFNLNSTRN